MDYKTAVKRIGRGEIAPIYVCYGGETYLIQELISRLTDKLVEPEHRAFAVTRYDLAETPVESVIEEAETLPFMVPRKLVVASNALFLTGAKESNKVEHRLEKLSEYMKSPVDYSVLIFTVDAEKLDERKKIVKSLKEADVLVPCTMLSADELTQWVTQEAKRRGFEFAPGVVDRLILYTGTSLQALTKEVEKCALFAGQGGTLTADDLEQLVSRTTEQNIFQLIEHIVQMQMDPAFTMLSELLRRKEEPIKIVMLVARQFRIMFQVKDLMSQGYSQQQIASQIGLHPYGVKIAAGQANRFDLKRLGSILQQLADLDFQMKSGRIDKVLGLELFLLRLAS
ncbi:DNA polymerase III subunit delta [Paenibacillus mucilaginosus]|uniref:DNA polymerase III subunit delta n=3 Tax=Paenibacillus mucilaginosus TaxID=61624 RepID=H6NII6_9BACL|nr:DNA polymerase III subunit delta [Paenibacillus mucilaginosus]AEI42695.1 DNA polymerase III subunit delta [Paenibacillus mucilaginosus KNP414]AFC32297.1 DNA polymerase III subunit delta [Paenibacillus mucilaginosus 3016]AFH64602.1 DNA polymerase III subunit delta [Paenibacillus mucilaginosus K02]MCG7217059.1 DNA polymerase III subunit delta [Paenibacillus mucilaginosus]WDM26079.1 DNA polymerase III subunit delta [Paenibacillus mucilaginosus]